MMPPDSMARYGLLGLVGLLFVAFFYQLGTPPLFDVDEGAFAEASREMWVSGDWVTPRLNGELRVDKPILIYWVQATSISLLGVNELALRLPSALAASLWVLAVWGFVRPRWGAATALLAGALVASNLLVMTIGRAATADALLNLWLTLAFFDAWRYLENPRTAPLLRLYLWLGLGLLTKGPIAIVLPFLVLSLFCFTTGRWRDWLRGSFYWPGWLVLLAVAAPWYILIIQAQGDAFLAGFWFKHNVGRYTETLESHGGFWAYYLILLPFILLPHTALLPHTLWRLRAHWHDPLRRFLLLWFLTVLILFSFSQTQLPHYLLYGLTPLFLLLAHHNPAQRFWLLGPLSLGLFWLSLPILLVEFPPKAAYLRDSVAQAALLFDPAYLALILSGIILWVWLGLRPLTLSGWLLACGLHSLLLAHTVLPTLGTLLQAPVRQAALHAQTFIAAHSPTQPVIAWQAHLPSFSVYRQDITPRREPQPGDVVFTRKENLSRLGPHRLLYAQGGVVLALITAP